MNFINKKSLVLIIFSLFFCILFSAKFVGAVEDSDFVPITKDAGNIWEGGGQDINLPGLIKSIYTYSIVISAILAVIMITIGGIQYMGSGSYTQTGAGRERMQNAVIGVLIVIGAVLMLETINPQIVELSLFEDVEHVQPEMGGRGNEDLEAGGENDGSECDYTTASRSGCTEKCNPHSSHYKSNSNCCICDEGNNGGNGGENNGGNGDCAENVNCGEDEKWDTRRCECVDMTPT